MAPGLRCVACLLPCLGVRAKWRSRLETKFRMSEEFVVDPTATQNLCSYFLSPLEDIFLFLLHLHPSLLSHPSCWSGDELEVVFEEWEALTLSG